jgi:protein gp37
MATKIDWCDETWNPITGCTPISEGCQNCYASSIAKRFWGARKFSDIQCHQEKLRQSWHWVKPKKIFVNSMSDLFHQDVPFEFIFQVFMYMLPSAANKWVKHTFMILTKRPDRMAEFIKWMTTNNELHIEWPLPNVWLGVTCENQRTADERIPILLSIPSEIKFVSIEPMLGEVDLNNIIVPRAEDKLNHSGYFPSCFNALTTLYDDVHFHQPPSSINWVICGGESGPQARPMHLDWVRSLRDQCIEADVPFFFKSWGEWAPRENLLDMVKVGKRFSGFTLDGQEWRQFPDEHTDQ